MVRDRRERAPVILKQSRLIDLPREGAEAALKQLLVDDPVP